MSVNWEEAITKIEENWTEDFDFREALVALYRIGSHSHGTHIPPTDPTGIDDTDFMAVVVPPMNRVCGIRKYEGSQWQKDGLDVVVYEWGKYIRLLLKSNPNVLGTLWLDEEDQHYGSLVSYPVLLQLRLMRGAFSSKQVYPAFMGYANAQLYKMTHWTGRDPGEPGPAIIDVNGQETCYLAGLFDGEGHVSIDVTHPSGCVNPIHVLQVGVTNTDLPIIERLKVLFGGTIGETGIKDGHRKNAYRWRVTGPVAASFLRTIGPHLRLKRQQAELGLEHQKSVEERRRGTPLTTDEVVEREDRRDRLVKSRDEMSRSVHDPFRDPWPRSLSFGNGYMGEKRKKLVAEFGYDVKNAAHLIRLLRMGTEFLETGRIQVRRDDAFEIIDIKKGGWDLRDVETEATALQARAAQALENSVLPETPDVLVAEDLMLYGYRQCWRT